MVYENLDHKEHVPGTESIRVLADLLKFGQSIIPFHDGGYF